MEKSKAVNRHPNDQLYVLPGVALARRTVFISSAGFAVFLVLTVLVHYRVLAGLDLAVALAQHPLYSKPLVLLGNALSILFAGELSLLYGLALALLFWRRGFRLLSLAPLSFLALVLLELILKSLIHQPGVPSDLHRAVTYPLATLDLAGSFPSGHSIRGAFFCTFLGLLLAHRGDAVGWLGALLLAIIGVLLAFTRVYIGDHWLTDVAGGMILGVALALPLAEVMRDYPPNDRDPRA